MNEESYDKIAGEFAEHRREAEPHEVVVEFAGLFKKGDIIFDVGCGSGLPHAKFLYERGLRVLGIDISEKLLEEAKKNVPDGQFVKADILHYGSAKKFPGILAWDSLFHLKPDEHETAFRKIAELLEDDGYFLFTHGGKKGEVRGEMMGQEFSYSSLGPEKTKVVLEKLGFEALKWEVDSQDNGYMIALMRKHAHHP